MLQSDSPFRKPCLASMKHEARQRAVFSHPSSHPMVATIPLPRPRNRACFREWLERLPQKIERVKGVCRFADSTALHELQFSRPAWRWDGPLPLRTEPDHVLVLSGQGHHWKRCGDALHSRLVATEADGPHFRASGMALKAVGGPAPRNHNRMVGMTRRGVMRRPRKKPGRYARSMRQ